MERKFGIFKTIEELNRAAAAQKAEGDYEALEALALENGLEKEDAEDYYNDETDILCTPFMAAVAKLEQEAKDLGLQSQLKDWKDVIVSMCGESDPLCYAVFAPTKHLEKVLGKALRECSDNRIRVPDKIMQAAGLSLASAYIGMIGRDELKRLIQKYYLTRGEES